MSRDQLTDPATTASDEGTDKAEATATLPAPLPAPDAPLSLPAPAEMETADSPAPERNEAGEASPADLKKAARRKSLSRHRLRASLLLALFGVIFLATGAMALPEGAFWIPLLHAIAEAALVGGLADWFAVTALFRHPLGLPIPHTKLIPKKKEKLGEGMANFITNHFLEPEHLQEKLHKANLALRLGHWLDNPANAQWMAERLVNAVPAMLDAVSDRDVRRFVRGTATRRLHHFNASALLGRLLGGLVERNQHGPVVASFADLARRLIDRHHHRLADYIQKKSGWFMPMMVDKMLAGAIVAAAEDLLASLSKEGHPIRESLENELQDLARRLKEDPELIRDVNGLKDRVLAMPATQAVLGGLWDDAKKAIIADVRDPNPTLGILSTEGLRMLGKRLVEDEALQARLNRALERILVRNITPWRGQIGNFIQEKVRLWTPEDVSDRIELEVGKDLQYIRINGTLVGGLIGGALFLGGLALESIGPG